MIFVYTSKKVMDELDEYKKLLKDLMSNDSEHFISPEDIYFDSLVIDAVELVGDHHVVWLN